MTETHYEVLKVSPDAPVEVIKASYAALIRRAHPDRGGDPELARRINEAKDVLLNPEARAKYDDRLRAEGGATAIPAEDEVVAEWGQDADWGDEPAAPPPFPGTPPPVSFPGTPPPVADPGPPPPAQMPVANPPPYGGPAAPPYGNVGTPPPYGGSPGERVPYGNVGTPGKRDKGPRLPVSNRQLWHGQTGAERITAWVWLALTLVGPIATTIGAVAGSESNLAGNLLAYALLFAASLHVAKERIVRSSLAKRYAVWVALAILLAISAGASTPLAGLFFGLWAACYVAAVELRRKRLWQQT